MNAKRQLRDLLVSLFSSQELNRFALYEFGPDVAYALPPGSLVEVAFALTDELDRRGYINEELFHKLIGARPGRRGDIEAVWSVFRGDQRETSPRPNTNGPTPRPGEPNTSESRQELVLLLTANIELGATFTDREAREVRLAVEAAKGRASLVFDHRSDTTINDIPARLRRDKPTVVHFAGAGKPGGYLILRDAKGNDRAMEPDGLLALIRGERLRLVVLNGSYTAPLAERLAGHVEAAVGYEKALEADLALAFSPPFYAALADGVRISEAFAISQAVVRAQFGDKADGYRLFTSHERAEGGPLVVV